MKAIIIGAGIGGLSTALGMAVAGIRDVQVLEAVPELKTLGAGISLLPHAVRALHRFGMAAALERSGIESIPTSYFDRHGNLIGTFHRGGRAAGDDWPSYHIHRGRLQAELIRRASEEFGSQAIRTDARVVSMRRDTAAVFVTIQRSNGTTEEIGPIDLLVAADGINSRIRQILHPTEGPARWNGFVMWRGVAPWHSQYDNDPHVYGGHAEQRFLSYPVIAPDGTKVLNWYAAFQITKDPEYLAQNALQDWNRLVNKTKVKTAFSGWEFGQMSVARIVDASPEVFEYPMVDRDPLKCWSYGRITLLGDAAHPMYPTGSNGAAQAILDADALSHALEDESSIDDALARYDRERVGATTSIVQANRKLAEARILQIVHERAPDGFSDVNAVVSREEIREIMGNYKKIAGWGPGITGSSTYAS